VFYTVNDKDIFHLSSGHFPALQHGPVAELMLVYMIPVKIPVQINYTQDYLSILLNFLWLKTI
jgi:hypothetical protein